MLVALVALAASDTKLEERALPVDPVVFGLVAFSVLLLLLGVTWAFRNVGKRH